MDLTNEIDIANFKSAIAKEITYCKNFYHQHQEILLDNYKTMKLEALKENILESEPDVDLNTASTPALLKLMINPDGDCSSFTENHETTILDDGSIAVQLHHDCDMYRSINFSHNDNFKVYLSTQNKDGTIIDLYEYEPEINDTNYTVDVYFSMARCRNPNIFLESTPEKGDCHCRPIPFFIRITNTNNFEKVVKLNKVFFKSNLVPGLVQPAA